MESQGNGWKDVFRMTESCLDERGVEAYAAGEVDPGFCLKVRPHVESCPRCSSEVSLYQEFAAGKVRGGEAADIGWIVSRLQGRASEITGSKPVAVNLSAASTVRKNWLESWQAFFAGWRLPVVGFAAAAVLFGVGVLVLYRTSPELTMPGLKPGIEVRSGAIEVAGPAGELETIPAGFEWRAIPGAASYRLRVFEVDGTTLWNGETSTAGLELPREISSKVVPGKKLLWQVTALDSDGRTMLSSEEVSFRLSPQARK